MKSLQLERWYLVYLEIQLGKHQYICQVRWCLTISGCLFQNSFVIWYFRIVKIVIKGSNLWNLASFKMSLWCELKEKNTSESAKTYLFRYQGKFESNLPNEKITCYFLCLLQSFNYLKEKLREILNLKFSITKKELALVWS